MSRLFTYKQRDDLLYKERDVSNTQRDVYVSKRQSYAYLLEHSEMTYFISSEISVDLLYKERDVYVLRCPSYGYSI